MNVAGVGVHNEYGGLSGVRSVRILGIEVDEVAVRHSGAFEVELQRVPRRRMEVENG
eukprot:CAMPEP_0182938262 /NCGR_PEP_ID=MMETSP0105_2-20130417/43567_1 /TAXON_ID=81532 ORGANISM="Acanthoeca-like sp., Strain 10tr" /NCGR_SAMPLE_ID=MMETSP0105_2 /ASSEMBLY_ACC=CAM_ASM_000205 /LENGTH=56 /DNA_ID=CAMNT_0025077549 /DNA_START=545 /DNA_END=711 /DNA_ORIENTATION=-